MGVANRYNDYRLQL